MGRSGTDAVADVLEVERRRLRAIVQMDADALAPLLADDLIFVHSSSAKDSKQSFLSAMLSGALLYRKLESSEIEARDMGGWVLVTGKLAVVQFANGRREEYGERFTATYVFQTGRWQLYCWQATRLPG